MLVIDAADNAVIAAGERDTGRSFVVDLLREVFVHGAELVGHVVVRFRQILNFVAGGNVDAMLEIAFGDAADAQLQIADGLRDCAVMVPDASVRAPHILSLRFPAGMPERLVERMAAEHVYVAPRVGRMRISPHVYNDEEDIDRFVTAFRRLTGA